MSKHNILSNTEYDRLTPGVGPLCTEYHSAVDEKWVLKKILQDVGTFSLLCWCWSFNWPQCQCSAKPQVVRVLFLKFLAGGGLTLTLSSTWNLKLISSRVITQHIDTHLRPRQFQISFAILKYFSSSNIFLRGFSSISVINVFASFYS